MSLLGSDASKPRSGAGTKPNVKVSLTVPADLPDLAVCQLLAFSGDSSGGFEEPVSKAMYPFRAPLVRSGVHPRFWPDYYSTIRQLARELRNGDIIFTAFVRVDENGDPVRGETSDEGSWEVAGMAHVIPPQSVLENVRKTQKWTERMLGDVVYPTVDAVQDKLTSDTTGMDTGFQKIFKKTLAQYRKKHSTEREFYILGMLYSHPKFQGCGVGSALLAKCISIASELEQPSNIPSLLTPPKPYPLYLESTRQGKPLYTRRGFVAVEDAEWSWRGKDFSLTIMIREPDSDVEPQPALVHVVKDDGEDTDANVTLEPASYAESGLGGGESGYSLDSSCQSNVSVL